MTKYSICERPVEIIRKDVRYLRLTVYENGNIRLTAPKLASSDVIQAFLDAKTPWLKKKMARNREQQGLSHELGKFESSITLWGERYDIRYHPAKLRAGVSKEDKILHVYHAAGISQARICLLNFLASEASDRLVPLLSIWLEKMELPPVHCAVRFMKSRWGSCTPSTYRIRINAWLATRHSACLEYVLVHELCHFQEKNHSPAFYSLLSHWLPDWRIREQKLKC